jgi:hypothetical protein
MTPLKRARGGLRRRPAPSGRCSRSFATAQDPSVLPPISRSSRALASLQSRATVSGETFTRKQRLPISSPTSRNQPQPPTASLAAPCVGFPVLSLAIKFSLDPTQKCQSHAIELCSEFFHRGVFADNFARLSTVKAISAAMERPRIR